MIPSELSNVYDAVIIGAGPSGLSLALVLRQAGWHVLVLEKQTLPREKVCGGFIGPENKPFLENFGIWRRLIQSDAHRISHMLLTSCRGSYHKAPLELAGKSVEGLGVSRRDFDFMMAETAQKNGVDILHTTVCYDRRMNSAIKKIFLRNVKNEKASTVSTRWLIEAFGTRSNKAASRSPQAMGIGAFFENVSGMDGSVHLHFVPGGHFGINQITSRKTNVCYVADAKILRRVGGDPENVFRYFLDQNPWILRSMKDARRLSPWKGVPIFKTGKPSFFNDGALRVGDAVAHVNPVVGGGISMALYGGFILGSILKQFDPKHVDLPTVLQQYKSQWEKELLLKIRLSWYLGLCGHQPLSAEAVLFFLKLSRAFSRNMFEFYHHFRTWPETSPMSAS